MKKMITIIEGDVIYSISDLAKAVGVTTSYCWQQIHIHKIWSEPTKKVGRRLYYDEPAFQKLVKEIESK